MSRVSQDVEPMVGLDFRRALPVATGTVMVLAGYSKDFSSAASMTQHVRLLLNICLLVTEPKWELSSFENPALI